MSVWSQARALARSTPPKRNRYIDFLRACAILVVVIGHWLAAAPYASEEGLTIVRMLGVAPWLHGLTWALQVMPVFFIVGGYANGASWEAALRDHVPYRSWLHARLVRLMAPVVPLLLVWAGMCIVAGLAGAEPALIQNASRLALIPTWFLAVYLLVVLLVPLTHAAWRRYGLASFWLPVSVAILVDALAFGRGFAMLRWTNYVFVWIAVHQLGYLWRSQRADDPPLALGWCLGGLSFLVFLVLVANYPIAMLTVPGAEFSNTRPPTVALVALAALQFGIVVLFQQPLRRWLRRPIPWTATVLLNGSIMTVFLWHSTVQVLAIGSAYALGGVGLTWTPGSAVWWATRPLWIGAMLVMLLPFVALFARYERGSRRVQGAGPSQGRQIAGALLACLGIGLLAGGGMSSPDVPWVRSWPLFAGLAGLALMLAHSHRVGVARQH